MNHHKPRPEQQDFSPLPNSLKIHFNICGLSTSKNNHPIMFLPSGFPAESIMYLVADPFITYATSASVTSFN
jgi:hypothetical protein